MKAINNGKSLTLHLSFKQAAVIAEALRAYKAPEAQELVDIMLNRQEVLIDDN